LTVVVALAVLSLALYLLAVVLALLRRRPGALPRAPKHPNRLPAPPGIANPTEALEGLILAVDSATEESADGARPGSVIETGPGIKLRRVR